MDAHRLLRSRTAVVLAGVGLTAAACGTGGNASTASNAAAGAPASSTVVSTFTVNGTTTLAGPDGHTLYDASLESPHHIACLGACTSFWKPVIASPAQARRASAALDKTFTVVRRPDGGTQLALEGHPLYTFTQEGPHQLSGNGFSDQFGQTHFQWSAAGVAAVAGSPAPQTSAPAGAYGGGGGYGGGY